MTHTVTYNVKSGVIETTARGRLTWDEAQELIAEIIRTAKEKHCFLCLSDYREATMELSTLQIHDLPKALSKVSNSLGFHPSQFKRAIVVNKSFRDFHFFETVTLNAGQNIKLFQDIEEARAWLLQE